MALPLFEHLGEIGQRISAARRVVVFSDFDGTLSPIVERPSAAELPSQARALLWRLSRYEHVHVAIVSGRAYADIRRRVGIPGLFYAGNCGLEICGPGLSYVDPVAFLRQGELARLHDVLTSRLAAFSGVAIENKCLSLAVHCRRVHPALYEHLRRAVEFVLAGERTQFTLTRGKFVLEISAGQGGGKRTAVQLIRRSLAASDSLPIYVGDDEVDEEAFGAVADGVGIKVGNPQRTRAAYAVDEPADVARFLGWLSRQMHES